MQAVAFLYQFVTVEFTQFFEFMQNLTFGETFVHFQGTADAFSHDAKALAVAIKVSETLS